MNDLNPPADPWAGPSPKPPWWKRRARVPMWGAIGAGAAFLLIGGALGAAGQQPAPKPKVETRTVTRTITKPGPTITVPGPTREVDVVPQACLDAISSAEDLLHNATDGLGAGAEIIGIQNQALQLAGNALQDPLSISDADASEMSSLSVQIDDQTAKLKDLTAAAGASGSAFQDAKAACQAAS